MSDSEIDEPRYSVVESERAEAERDKAYLRLLGLVGPDAAHAWYRDLRAAIAELPEFPGPLAHAIDEEASDLFSREVRRMLYWGPKGRKSRTAYRVYFTLIPPGEGETETTILVLRILHGARRLVSNSDDGEEV